MSYEPNLTSHFFRNQICFRRHSFLSLLIIEIKYKIMFKFEICALLVFCFAINLSSALYFHISETERKCFIEEIPDETLVLGKCCLHCNCKQVFFNKTFISFDQCTTKLSFMIHDQEDLRHQLKVSKKMFDSSIDRMHYAFILFQESACTLN